LGRILFFSKNSANGSLQSTSVTGPENRQRRVWGRTVTFDDQTARVQTRRSQTGHDQSVSVLVQIATKRPLKFDRKHGSSTPGAQAMGQRHPPPQSRDGERAEDRAQEGARGR
jgi:hypothetical protein